MGCVVPLGRKLRGRDVKGRRDTATVIDARILCSDLSAGDINIGVRSIGWMKKRKRCCIGTDILLLRQSVKQEDGIPWPSSGML